MEEVCKNIFMFQVPLPKSALKSINIYLIKTEDRAVVFDTGYNTQMSKDSMVENLKRLDLEIKDCDLILTHLHADHTGLASFFYERGARIYAGKVDGDLMNGMAEGSYWKRLGSFIPLYDMTDEIALEDNPGYNFRLSNPVPYNQLEIGDVLKMGEYNLRVVDLIGHTPGHMGLYEEEKKFLFSADTVLEPITPNITFWGYEWKDILNAYMNTLRKIKAMKVEKIFSTHRSIITEPNRRIDEIIHHHFLRLQEILDSMDETSDYTIREISRNISWKIRADSWEEFPKPQKWFATGETMAHVEFLVNRGYVSQTNDKGVLKFRKLTDKVSFE